jgi:hypothetical protein
VAISRLCQSLYSLKAFMFSDVDYFFNYRYIVRFVLTHKLNCFSNTFQVPELKCLVFFFSINELLDLEDVRTFNYFYIFRFFLGNRSFFTKFNSFFSLGRTFYTFNVQSFFAKRFMYFTLLFLVNDVLAFMKRSNYSYFFGVGSFTINFYDMNVFLEKKTNLALFSLKDFLGCRFFFSLKNFRFYSLFLNILKLI